MQPYAQQAETWPDLDEDDAMMFNDRNEPPVAATPARAPRSVAEIRREMDAFNRVARIVSWTTNFATQCEIIDSAGQLGHVAWISRENGAVVALDDARSRLFVALRDELESAEARDLRVSASALRGTIARLTGEARVA